MNEKSNNIFILEKTENTICEIKLDSDILLLLPRTKDLNNIEYYKNLKYLEINNFKIGPKENKILENNSYVLKNITHLKIWNVKLNNLEILQYFPKLTHLLISYIRTDDFSFDGLKYTDKINTLCLISANKIVDFNFLKNSIKIKIKNLSITYCKMLNNLSGINKYKNLECLELNFSTAESGKRAILKNIKYIEHLEKLKYLEINYYNFDINDLQNYITNITNLKDIIIDYKKYKKGGHCA
jgi:hypothetical protein